MGKIAAVTGAAGGLGRMIVAALGGDGFQVYGLDIDTDGLNTIPQAGFTPCPVDLTDAEAVKAIFARNKSPAGLPSLPPRLGMQFHHPEPGPRCPASVKLSAIVEKEAR